jgi:CBS domain-containing protein
MQPVCGQCILGEEDPGSALDLIDNRQAKVSPQHAMFPVEFALPETPSVASAEARALPPAQVSSIAVLAYARLLTVGVDAKLVDVAAQMSAASLSLAVVCELSGAVAGVIADTMLVYELGLGQASIFTARAGDVMARQFTACHPADSLPDVLASMHNDGLIHVPVVDGNNRPQGVVYARDGLRALLAAGNFEEARLRDYVMGAGYE